MNLPSQLPLNFMWPQMLWLLLTLPLLVALYVWLLRRRKDLPSRCKVWCGRQTRLHQLQHKRQLI